MNRLSHLRSRSTLSPTGSWITHLIVVQGAAAVNKTLGELDLASLAVEVTAVRRRNIRGLLPSSDTCLEVGDVIVLRGTQENLAAAEIRLMQG
ncbi:MAG: TrkA C-terminal domain-containing protein [Nitrosomonas sp.]|nr:TrkA C-terminal domain-containing protein [Nitrosomonas sp.]MDP1951844.1 TrkA C-terminal domain-containing protein [Nitrosomonas sp.]